MRRSCLIIQLLMVLLAAVSLDCGVTLAGGADDHGEDQVVKATGHEVFCREKKNFLEYLAVTRTDKFSYHAVSGCMQLKKDTRYKVVGPDLESGMTKIHILGGRASGLRGIDGYILVENQ
jgi:hypothetical protein